MVCATSLEVCLEGHNVTLFFLLPFLFFLPEMWIDDWGKEVFPRVTAQAYSMADGG